MLGCSQSPRSWLLLHVSPLDTPDSSPTAFPLLKARNPVCQWPQSRSDAPPLAFSQGVRHRLRGSVNAVRIRAPQIGGESPVET